MLYVVVHFIENKLFNIALNEERSWVHTTCEIHKKNIITIKGQLDTTFCDKV